LQVEAIFACGGIIGPVRSGAYEILEGSTISDLLDKSLAERLGPGSGPSRKNVNEMLIFMRNGKQAQPDTKLAEGDKVHILLKIFGG